MMRWVLFSVAVIVVAAAATVGSTLLTADSPKDTVLTGRDTPAGPPAAVTVEGPLVYNFGKKPQWVEGDHDWILKNDGQGEARLSIGNKSCSCTTARFESGETSTLAPGATTKVKLGYNTKTWDHFHHWAHILVQNDPSHQDYELVIEGTVHPPIITFPSESTLNMLKVKSDAPNKHEIALGSIDLPDTKVTGVLANPSIFVTEVEPLTADQAKQLKLDKGWKVVIKVKPGATIGPFAEELVIKTDHPKRPEVKMTLTGKVEGPIELTPERFRLLDVSAKQGGSQTLKLWVRGQKSTKFTVEQKPEKLDVEIAPDGSASENSAKYTVTIKVPANFSGAGNISGDIILKTDHPKAGEVKIPVAIFIRSS
jgi:hypothetical protein